jgi:hypothetical protein
MLAGLPQWDTWVIGGRDLAEHASWFIVRSFFSPAVFRSVTIVTNSKDTSPLTPQQHLKQVRSLKQTLLSSFHL